MRWFNLIQTLAVCFVVVLTGSYIAQAYQAEDGVGDAQDTGVSNPTTDTIKVGAITIGAGGQWTAGISDDMICLQEVGVAGDNICFKTNGDALYVYQGDGTSTATVRANLISPGTIESTSTIGFQSNNPASPMFQTQDTTAPGDTNAAGQYRMRARGSDSVFHTMASINLAVTDATAGAEYADMTFEATTNGVDATEYFRLDSSAGAVVLSKPLVVPTFTKSKHLTAGSVALGPTAPTWEVQDTLAGLRFDAAAESAGWTVEVDNCWDGISDMKWKIYVTTEAGDVIADTEVIEFDCTYRALADDEASDNGTAVTINPSYTQSGAGTDSSRHKLEAVLDYDSANQPLTAGDMIHMRCNRDVGASDTYSGFVILEQAELEFECTTIPNH